MSHTACCPDTQDIPFQTLPTTEDRPAYARRIDLSSQQDFPAQADVQLSFEPTETYITAPSNMGIVEVSYDGIQVHQIVEPGEQVRLTMTHRRRFWFRQAGYGVQDKGWAVNFRAGANQRRGAH
jgi:hypothetical protein